MSDRPDLRSDDPSDDRLAAAEHRAAAAEHRAHVAEGGDVEHDRGRQTVSDSHPTYGFGSLLAFASAAAIALSAFLNWAQDDFFESVAFKGYDVPMQFLWDTSPASFGEPSLLWLLLGAAIAVVVGTFIPRLRVLAIVGGAVALATAVLYFISVTRVLSDFDDAEGAFNVVAIGMWVAAAGGLVAIIGSLIIPKRTTTTVR